MLRIGIPLSKIFLSIFSLLAFCPVPAMAIGQCPTIGYSTSCGALITITPTGKLTIDVDPSVDPYDGSDDTLVGVLNNSGATVFGITLTGNGIFGFDGDGANAGDYAGPGTAFDIQDANTGIVNFPSGLDDGGFLWFSLEGPPSTVHFSRVVTLDPGHGSNCAAVPQPVGTVGDTDYTTFPVGYLREDDLTVLVSNATAPLLTNLSYSVTQTKTDPVSCPTFHERGELANKAGSNLLVSVHFNAPRGYIPGVEGIYTTAKADSATLAGDLQFGVVNATNQLALSSKDGTVDAILKPTVTRMTASIIECGRLSGFQEDYIHDPASIPEIATGITNGIEAFVNPTGFVFP